MREAVLRSILLIKAIEETDRTGSLIPLAERVAAAREAVRSAGSGAATDAGADARRVLSTGAQRLLAARAAILQRQVIARHPVVATALAAAGGPAWIGLLLFVLGVASGLLLSAFDGSRRIDILAPALVALVLWNLVVYVLVLAGWMRGFLSRRPRRHPLAGAIVENGLVRLTRLALRAADFSAPLAAALQRFAGAWREATAPLLLQRAVRLFHLGAAGAGIGLIAGLYARGIVLDYQAGWESTFLDAAQVHTLLAALYGPAALISGSAVPDAAHIAALRWQGGAGGERAALWIHLFATSAALFVVAPRLLLVALGTLRIAQWSHAAPLPPALATYCRSAFGGADSTLGRGVIMVQPYACNPNAQALAQLRELLPSALGEGLAVDLRAGIAYGEEDAFVHHLADRGGGIADVLVLLFNLAATPEDENHGIVIAGARDWLTANRRHIQLLVLVDAGPYAARMGAQGGALARLAERERAWHDFVAARGLAACIVDLATPVPRNDDSAAGSAAASPAFEALVERVRAALWQPAPAPQ